MHLKLVIPTRNRAALTQTATGSILDQGAPNVSVLVSDNSTAASEREALDAFVRQTGNERVEYARPPRPLSMTTHWEWAMGRALADASVTHVGFLPDRWVLRHRALPTLTGIARRHPRRVVTYGYDEVIDHVSPARLVQHHWTGAVIELDAQHLLDLGAAGEFPDAIPRMLNTVVPRTVVDAVRRRFGSVFASIAPDYCFAFRCLEVEDAILFWDASCSAHYALDRSHGFSQARRISTPDRKQFIADLGDTPMNSSTPLPGFDSITNAIFNEYFFVLGEGARKLRRPPPHAYLGALASGLHYLEDERERDEAIAALAAYGWRWRGARGRQWLERRAQLLRFFARRPGTLLRRLAGRWQHTGPGRAFWRRAISRGATPPAGAWLEFEDPADAVRRARGPRPRRAHDFSHIPNLVDPPGVARVLESDPAA